jgi:lactate dehydrogenase-like 2-hydroxyacid dehydrogenase
MKPVVLMISNVYEPTFKALEAKYTLHHLWRATDRDALLASLPRITAAVTSGGVGATRELLGRLPQLEILACFGVGVDAIDLAYAAQRGIRVTNTPDVLTDDVADLALGLMLATARRIVEADRYVRSGAWLRGPMPLNMRMHGKRLGIAGMGRIGQAIAARATAFNMSVAYHGPRPKDVPHRYEPDLVALARSVDFLVAACPGGAATRGLISREVIEALGAKGIFINIARGSVVDEPALVDALVNGRLAGAGLDVFADEPRVPEALLELDHVVLQPHQASATHETRAAMGQLVLDNLAAHFSGRPLLTPVA